MSKWQREKKAVLEASRRMFESGLVVGTAGNASLRLKTEDDRQFMAITPSSRRYEELEVEDIQIIDFEGRGVEGSLRPSMETKMHAAIYRVREDVNAVIHTHSVFASAVSVTGNDIPAILDDQVAFLGGEIKLARYAPTGSDEQVNNVLAALGDRSGVLLANHGAVGTGKTIRDAFTACELIEKTARIYVLAQSAGKINTLPPQAVEAEKALYDKFRRDSGGI